MGRNSFVQFPARTEFFLWFRNHPGVWWTNLLKNCGFARRSSVISVESDEPKESDLFPTNEQQDMLSLKLNNQEVPHKQCQSDFQTQVGIRNCFRLLPKDITYIQSSKTSVEKTNADGYTQNIVLQVLNLQRCTVHTCCAAVRRWNHSNGER